MGNESNEIDRVAFTHFYIHFTPFHGFDIGFTKIPENSAWENFGGIIPDFREHFFGNFGFPDLEAL